MRFCSNCRFWARSRVKDGYGQCHRYAPRASVLADPEMFLELVSWPVTLSNDACGEHEASSAYYLAEKAKPKADE